MKNIRWGIIGCGDVTEVKSGPAFQRARNSELAAVMRRNGALAKEYAQRHHVPRWFDNADDLLRESDIDAVYIATPPVYHKAYALAAIAAGKPVLVEKPMGMNYAETAEMAAAAHRSGVPLFTAYYRRALPRFLKVQSLLNDGAIGQIQSVHLQFSRPPLESDLSGSTSWRVDPAVAGAGYFYDLGSHMIDLIQFLVSPISEASGSSANNKKLYAAEDTVSAQFTCRTGVSGTGKWNFAAEQNADRTEIVGSEGSIFFPTFTEGPIVLHAKAGREEIHIPNPPHVHQPLIQSVVDELLGIGRCSSTGDSGSQTQWVLDKILGRLR
jgi:predicted dehydrogenase